MRVIVQLRSSPAAHAAAMGGAPDAAVTAGIAQNVPGLTIDQAYPPVQIPAALSATGGHFFSLAQPMAFSMEPTLSTYVVRGQIPDGQPQQGVLAAMAAHPDIVGVFSDPVIESCIACPGDPAVGAEADVATLLDVKALHARGMDGTGVYVAVVDTGINLAYLKSKGRSPHLVTGKSWTPAGVATKPGRHPVHHGTMCAYDVGIAAPKARLLDDAVLLSRTPGATTMAGLLSDAVLAYSKLRQVLSAMPAATRALVISNSWGMFSPTWDFPPGHPGNYSDNPAHPFNIIVGSLESAGADILFAAGNCGRDCPDGRCAFGPGHPICGANSHPAVISVAGCDTTKARVGYSSQGPGRLAAQKPDVAAFTHFAGSGVFKDPNTGAPEPDSGTSAACPVAAGLVAAVRSKHSATSLPPAQLRAMLFKTAKNQGAAGFNFDEGWGVIDSAALLKILP
jgi:subtilisin family serine protease